MGAPPGKTELEWLAKDHPETNPITIKPETVRERQSCSPGFPYLLLSTRVPFPIKSLALSACVSSDNSFLSVRQEPSFGPWKGSPFLQQAGSFVLIPHLKFIGLSCGKQSKLELNKRTKEPGIQGWWLSQRRKVRKVGTFTTSRGP